MKDYIIALENSFKQHANKQIAIEQSAYMKNLFLFYGIKTPVRRKICQPFLEKNYLPSKRDAWKIIQTLWKKPERENHYFAQELLYKFVKQFEKKDFELIQWMIKHQSWWDTVDFIAAKPLGEYLKMFPEQIPVITEQWMRSGNIWLQRSCILFQLKYKQKVDTKLLSKLILQLSGSKEFFINKAIGWMLREYSKTNPVWVKRFSDKTLLSNLSRREALRLMEL